MRKAKLSLIASITIGLLAISTAGVSTYAWLSTASSVGTRVNSQTSTISIEKPDDLEVDDPEFYAFKGNYTDNYATAVANSSITGNDYELATAENGKREITDFWPGQSKTFCVHLHVDGGVIGSASMVITYSSVQKTNRHIVGSSNCVSILTASNLYGWVNTTGVYATNKSNTDLITYTEGNLAANSNQSTSSVDASSLNTTDVYLFYTLEFSDLSSTYYQEYTANNASTANKIKDTPRSDASARYFAQSNSGNSTCYEGLEINITNIAITLGY